MINLWPSYRLHDACQCFSRQGCRGNHEFAVVLVASQAIRHSVLLCVVAKQNEATLPIILLDPAVNR